MRHTILSEGIGRGAAWGNLRCREKGLTLMGERGASCANARLASGKMSYSTLLDLDEVNGRGMK